MEMLTANPDYENFTYEEVCSIPNYELFEPDLGLWNEEHVKRLIYNAYRYKEIEFDTPDRFKNRLNHYLRLRAKVYNDKWKAAFLEFDPLVTDYIDERVNEISIVKEKNVNDAMTDTFSKNTGLSESKQTGGNNWSETGGEKNLKNKADTMMKGTLFSSAENQETDGEVNVTEGIKTSADKTGTGEKHRTDDTTITERVRDTGNKDYTKQTVSNEDYASFENTDKNGTENQTEGNWTEKGVSDGHKLNVSSDTPVPMLFNQPAHIYGTGRTGIKGKVKTDANGNQYLEDFYESDPKQFDFSAYDVGSGESPWFNYASGADNNISQDSYDKSGTNTYKRDSSEVGNKNIVGDRDANVNEEYEESHANTKTTDRDDLLQSDETSKETSSETGSKDTTNDKVEHVSDSKTVNTDEDVKQDEFSVESNIGATTKTHTADVSTDGRVHNYGDSESNTRTKDKSKRDERSSNDVSRVKKGRSFKSPSALMAEYRNLLTFNPDEWLLAEIRPLFSDLY